MRCPLPRVKKERVAPQPGHGTPVSVLSGQMAGVCGRSARAHGEATTTTTMIKAAAKARYTAGHCPMTVVSA